jgi:hypothetical protein
MLRLFLPALIISLTAGCATEQAKDVADTTKLAAGSQKENILACVGLPMGGQKCGLALPDVSQR